MGKTIILNESQLNRLLYEENQVLYNNKRGYKLPPKLFQYINNIYNEVKNKDNIGTIAGFKRIKNIIEREGVLTYGWMKRIKNFFDDFNRTGKDKKNNLTYYLNGGIYMEKWVNETLDKAEEEVKNSKQLKKDTGMKNSFRKKHFKIN
ncbi:MAG: hypothetical protein M0R03_14530 [Novosphingobium sp.]|nr:hypothetical protein [Novosphingobium sp.]